MYAVDKILVVDDQLGVRSLLVEAFQEDQYKVEAAENGEVALRSFIAFKPHLILMDIKMPVMNGIEALRKIRILDSRVPVIMMTAYGDIQNMETAKGLGIFSYINKPFDLFELKERVREILHNIPS